MTDPLSFWISGQPPRKSNSRRIVLGVNGPRLIKSQQALVWTKDAILQIPADARQGLGSADQPVSVTCHCYYESHRPDLSIELILDALQKAGVISDDRYVYQFHAFKHFSKTCPGVRVTVEECTT